MMKLATSAGDAEENADEDDAFIPEKWGALGSFNAGEMRFRLNS